MTYVVQRLCPQSGVWIDQDYFEESQLEDAIFLCRRISAVEGCQARVTVIATGDTVFFAAEAGF